MKIIEKCTLSNKQRKMGILCRGIFCIECNKFKKMEEISNIEDNITCPYCGDIDYDSQESGLDYDGASMECECDNCNKWFYVSKCITIDYRAKGLCEMNSVEHNWKEFDTGKCKGKICLTCDKHIFD